MIINFVLMLKFYSKINSTWAAMNIIMREYIMAGHSGKVKKRKVSIY